MAVFRASNILANSNFPLIAALGIYMNPSKQAENYDKIASHWASDNFNLENGIEQHKRALQFSQNKESAIDVGCGSSGRIIEILLNDGF